MAGRSWPTVAILVSLGCCWKSAEGACFVHQSCSSCLSEFDDKTACLWYKSPLSKTDGSCLAGSTGERPTILDGDLAVTDSYSTWSMEVSTGARADFMVWYIDQYSEGACYATQCAKEGRCDLGYFPVWNQPCYGNNLYPNYRILKCCREQRNFDGYLLGFDSLEGVVQGDLFYASCCSACWPGQVSKGCDAYNPGECKTCPKGRFNPISEVGGECKLCQPCAEGLERNYCGPSQRGRCDECEIGRFKELGVEGVSTDRCQKCPSCPHGSVRVDCGGSSPGTCKRCQAGQFYSTPFCRICGLCQSQAGHMQDRFGCGGRSEGVCSACSQGRYAVGQACTDCETCPADALPDWVAGLDVSANPPVLVGCGSVSKGRCVRFGVAIEDDVQRCQAEGVNDAFCRGSAINLRWALAGLTFDQLKTLGGDTCTVDSGVCIAALWRVELRRRMAPITGRDSGNSISESGEEMLVLGEWWPEELDGSWPMALGLRLTENASDAFLAKVRLRNFPRSLPAGSGYFIRVSFSDNGNACCGSSREVPLVADTGEFTIVGSTAAMEAALDAAPELSDRGKPVQALTQMQDACADDGDGSPDAVILQRVACDRASAMRLAEPLGASSMSAAPLILDAAEKPEFAARMATVSAAEARNLRNAIEQLRKESETTWLPSTSSSWQLLGIKAATYEVTAVGGIWTNQAAAHVPLAQSVSLNSPYGILLQESLKAADLANSSLRAWRRESDYAAAELKEFLNDLKTIDMLLGNGSYWSGYNVVRQSQAVLKKLKLSLQTGVPTKQSERETWFRTAFERIGINAFMHLGAWSSSWRNGIDWRITSEVGNLTNFPPPLERRTAGLRGEIVVEAVPFGEASLPDDAAPLEKARARVWGRFQQMAKLIDDMYRNGPSDSGETETLFTFTSEGLPRMRRLNSWGQNGDENETTVIPFQSQTTPNPGAEDSRTTEETIPETPTSFQTLDKLAADTLDIVNFVQELTEKVLDMMNRPGNTLLAGSFPHLTGCGLARRLCLSDLMDTFPQSLAIEDAILGFGSRSVRPWATTEVEYKRLSLAATEVVRMARARCRLFEEVLLRTADLRETLSETHLANLALKRAVEAANHIALVAHVASTPGPIIPALVAPGADWRRKDICSLLRKSMDKTYSSADRLGRRRLTALEDLATLIGGGDWGFGHVPWRVTLQVGRYEAFRLSDAVDAARAELERSLASAINKTFHSRVGLLRKEFHPEDAPVAFAALHHQGAAVFQIAAPVARVPVLMHKEAYAFFLSHHSYVLPLKPEDAEAPVAANAYSTDPHVELRLRRLSGPRGIPRRINDDHLKFTTRHAKGECKPLWERPERGGAALWPMEEVWVVEALDGSTQSKLKIDEHTSLRLLFQVDVPQQTPPWTILDGPPDVLYELAEDGECDGLSTIFGQKLESTTTTQFLVVEDTTQTTTTKTNKVVYIGPNGESRSKPFKVPMTTTTTVFNESLFQVGQSDTEKAKSTASGGVFGVVDWLMDSFPMWFVVSILVASTCVMFTGCGYTCWCCKRRARRHKQLSKVAALPPEVDQEQMETLKSKVEEAIRVGLRPRSPKNASEVEGQDVPTIHVTGCETLGPKTGVLEANWGPTDTPRDLTPSIDGGSCCEYDSEVSSSSSSDGLANGKCREGNANNHDTVSKCSGWTDGATPIESSNSSEQASPRSSLSSPCEDCTQQPQTQAEIPFGGIQDIVKTLGGSAHDETAVGSSADSDSSESVQFDGCGDSPQLASNPVDSGEISETPLDRTQTERVDAVDLS